MGQIYNTQGLLSSAQVVEEKLIRQIPWIEYVYKSSPLDAPRVQNKKANMETLKKFMELPAEDRKLLTIEIKGAWAFAEAIRSSFKMLVEDFVETESSRVRLGIYVR